MNGHVVLRMTEKCTNFSFLLILSKVKELVKKNYQIKLSIEAGSGCYDIYGENNYSFINKDDHQYFGYIQTPDDWYLANTDSVLREWK